MKTREPPPRPPDAPRSVPPLRRLLAVRTWVLVILGIVFALDGVVITAIFVGVGGPPWDDWILDRRATRVEASPLSVEETARRRNRRRMTRISFAYRAPDGSARTGAQDTIDPALIGRAEARQPLTVEIDPEDPARHRIVGERASLFGNFLALPVGFAASGVLLLALAMRAMRRDRRIYREGDATLATVISVRPANLNLRRTFHVEYELATSAGTVRGRRLFVDPPAEGARVWVFYDPARPDWHVFALDANPPAEAAGRG